MWGKIYTKEEEEEFINVIEVLKKLNKVQQFGVKMIIDGVALAEIEKEKQQRKLCRKS